MRACGAEQANDVDLFSLVNILTVAMVGTRPTAHRMGQMARNQLKGRDAKSILLSLYEEVMGDEESNRVRVLFLSLSALELIKVRLSQGPVSAPRRHGVRRPG